MSVQSKRAASTARTWLGYGLVLASASLAGCSSQTVDQPVSAAVESPAPAEQSKPPSTPALENFDASNYEQSTQINNPWMPLKPGTRFTYNGNTVEDDGTVVPHRIVINVTDLTKVIGGVRSLVTWDLDYSDGELVEAELAFFAQDKTGNVWRMGEYPEEYEEGKFVAAPAWIHGFENARAGIMMQANPQPKTPSYSQGWGPAVNWTDRGQVDKVGQKTIVAAGKYDDVVVIAETSAAEPDAEQLKYYARGVGNVRVGWRGAGEKTKETLELSKVEMVDAKGLAEMRAAALKMEKAAYQRSKNVYAKTPPVEPMPAVQGQ
jgi:hypothetical protein